MLKDVGSWEAFSSELGEVDSSDRPKFVDIIWGTLNPLFASADAEPFNVKRKQQHKQLLWNPKSFVNKQALSFGKLNKNTQNKNIIHV